MKKIIAIILSFIFVCGLVGCAETPSGNSSYLQSEESGQKENVDMATSSEKEISSVTEQSSKPDNTASVSSVTSSKVESSSTSTSSAKPVSSNPITSKPVSSALSSSKPSSSQAISSAQTSSAQASSAQVSSAQVSSAQLSSMPVSSTPVSSQATSSEAEPIDAAVSESPLSNTYKLLTSKKKLTIGYIGGSITYGSSAANVIADGKVASTSGGNLGDSWVNRVSTWFKNKYSAEIVTVNAGVSDTATNYGLFRLATTLMNENGHDMPDLVFVEFTTNDWDYSTQTIAELELQAESLFCNIWKHNPYAEIVVVSTSTKSDGASYKAYKAVAAHYGIPFIDVGTVLQGLKTARGAASESEGTLYYTVDNLHPSALGYGEYFKVIEPALLKHLEGLNLKSTLLYKYGEHLPTARAKDLILNPIVIPANTFKATGRVQPVNTPVTANMYGTAMTVSPVQILPNYLSIGGNYSKVTVTFEGPTLGMLFKMTSAGINMKYTIDGGETKTFAVDDNNFGWQRYDHVQVFMLEHHLSSGSHTVVFEFMASESAALNVGLCGILTNGK